MRLAPTVVFALLLSCLPRAAARADDGGGSEAHGDPSPPYLGCLGSGGRWEVLRAIPSKALFGSCVFGEAQVEGTTLYRFTRQHEDQLAIDALLKADGSTAGLSCADFGASEISVTGPKRVQSEWCVFDDESSVSLATLRFGSHAPETRELMDVIASSRKPGL